MRFVARLMKSWFILVLVVFGIYLTVCNQERMHVHFPPWIEQLSLPAYVVELGFFILGALIMSLHFGGETVRKSLEIRRLTKRLRELGEGDQSDTGAKTDLPLAGPASGSPSDEGL